MISRELRLGIYGGIACICYTFIVYMIRPGLIVHPAVWWSGMIFFIIPMIPAARKADISLPPSPFRRRMRSAFVVFLTADILFYLFYWLLLSLGKDTPEATSLGETFFRFAYGLIGGFIIAAIIAYFTERNP